MYSVNKNGPTKIILSLKIFELKYLSVFNLSGNNNYLKLFNNEFLFHIFSKA